MNTSPIETSPIDTSIRHNPVLPGFFRWPLAAVPSGLKQQMFCRALNHLLKQPIADDELEFLQDRSIAIIVTDANLKLCFSFSNNKIISPFENQQADITMQGSTYDFLLMLSRKEDPDTLFFNRRLKLSGDTELGLYVKNFLDGLEFSEQQKAILKLSDGARKFAERFG